MAERFDNINIKTYLETNVKALWWLTIKEFKLRLTVWGVHITVTQIHSHSHYKSV